MLKMDLEKLKYPIGKFVKPQKLDSTTINKWIGDIENFPEQLVGLTKTLDHEKLRWKYRPNGWTIKQLVHHCGDSHMNSLIRFKLALTENNPTIKPYFEDRWAELPDSKQDDINDSLLLLISLHKKWSYLLRHLNSEDLKKNFVHPENNQIISLGENIGIYAWHSNHHLAHIKQALTYKGQFNNVKI